MRIVPRSRRTAAASRCRRAVSVVIDVKSVPVCGRSRFLACTYGYRRVVAREFVDVCIRVLTPVHTRGAPNGLVYALHVYAQHALLEIFHITSKDMFGQEHGVVRRGHADV